jgi:hypothetical protein
MRIGKGNRSTQRKPTPVPLCPPQILHDLTWARSRAAAVGNRQLTTTYASSLNQAKHLEDSYRAVNVAVTLYTRIRSCWVRNSFGTLNIVTVIFCSFPLSLQGNIRTTSRLYHNFVPNPLQFIIQPITRFHCLATNSVAK